MYRWSQSPLCTGLVWFLHLPCMSTMVDACWNLRNENNVYALMCNINIYRGHEMASCRISLESAVINYVCWGYQLLNPECIEVSYSLLLIFQTYITSLTWMLGISSCSALSFLMFTVRLELNCVSFFCFRQYMWWYVLLLGTLYSTYVTVPFRAELFVENIFL